MKKIILLAALALAAFGCTDKECWKCELTSAEKIGEYYIVTDKYIDCNENIDKMISHWMERGRVSSVKCTNLETGEILTNEDLD